MDRQAIVRAQRRRQAMEALEFERAREEALRDQIETIVAELDGPALDEAAFAAMSPEQAEVVRIELYGADPEPLGEEWALPLEDPEDDPAIDPAEQESEIARLEGEIAASLERQRAFEAYLEAIGEA
jgi:hypothetical protein